MPEVTAQPGLHHPDHAKDLEVGIAKGGGQAYTPEDVRGSGSARVEVALPAEPAGETLTSSLVDDINSVITGAENKVGSAPASKWLGTASKRGM